MPPGEGRSAADILDFRPRPRAVVDRLAPLSQIEMRAELEGAARMAMDVADQLIAILDRIDGDPDLEPGGGDEPSLGAPEEHGNSVVWFRGTARDLELDQQPETSL